MLIFNESSSRRCGHFARTRNRRGVGQTSPWVAAAMPTRSSTAARQARTRPAPMKLRILDCAARSRTWWHRPARLLGVSSTWCRWFDSSRGHHCSRD